MLMWCCCHQRGFEFTFSTLKFFIFLLFACSTMRFLENEKCIVNKIVNINNISKLESLKYF